MAHHYNYNEISSIQGFSSSSSSHDLFGAHQAGIDILGKQQGFFPGAAEIAASAVSRRWDDSSSASLQLKAAAAQLQQQQQQLLLMQQEHGGTMMTGSNYLQAASLHHQQAQQPLHLMRNSRFFRAAQELLKEFCSPGSVHGESGSKKKRSPKNQEARDSAALYSMESSELQRIKDKLLSMLDEVDKRYRQYREQMRVVVVSFEAAAGEDAAKVYSALASKAMSRHFRCLRDGIVGQLRSVKKSLGEKDLVVAAGAAATRGETPRLKLLDRCMRQEKAFQQGFMEQPPWRPQRGLPERSVSILRAWLFEHFLHPYPSDVDKHILAKQTGLTRSQVSNWFINARVRLWKPMVEEMYLQEMKELDNNNNNNNSNSGQLAATGEEDSDNPNSNLSFDRKPPLLLGADSESLSSIINISMNNVRSHHHHHHQQQHHHQSRIENFGVINDLDFSYGGNNSSGNESRSGVSLTLGLQQHSMNNGGGMGLSLLPNSSLLFSREGNVHGSEQLHGLGGGGDQNLPYRNLMEAQLLHDLAR